MHLGDIHTITKRNFVGVDQYGNDSDDYASMIIKRLLAIDFDSTCNPEAYRNRVISNCIRSYKRRLKRDYLTIPFQPISYNPERMYVARMQLQKLKEYLTEVEFETLFVYGMLGTLRDTWAFFGRPGSYSTYHRKFERIRKIALNFLEMDSEYE